MAYTINHVEAIIASILGACDAGQAAKYMAGNWAFHACTQCLYE
jgi:hypothetical protein